MNRLLRNLTWEIQRMRQQAIIGLGKILHVTGGLKDHSREIRKGPDYLMIVPAINPPLARD